MKVLVITPWFPSENNPIAGIFHLRDVELISKSHDVTVIHLDDSTKQKSIVKDKNQTSTNFELLRVPYSLWRPLDIFRSRKFLRAKLPEYDVIHTMSGPALIPLHGIQNVKPWVHTEHWTAFARKPYTLRERLGLAVIRDNYERPDVVVAVSSFLKIALEKVRSGPVTVIGNFVGKVPTELVKRAPGNRIRIVCVGSLVVRKSPFLALETLKSLQDKGVDAELIWIGDGPLEHKVRQLAKRLEVNERLTLLGDVPNEDVYRELEQADVFFSPADLETFGVAIGEAMMSGLPVVTAHNGGSIEFLHKESSRVVRERSAVAFANAILGLINQHDLPVRAEIMQYAQHRFSEEVRATKYEQVYAQALSNHK